MVVKLAPKLGTGLYTIPEAASYAKITPQRLARWVFGSKDGKPVLTAQYGNGERILSYLDFIQAVAIREIRTSHRIPLHKFREAIAYAQKKYDMQYPFAMDHVTFWNEPSKTIIISPPGSDEYIEASGKSPGQRLFKFVEIYLKDLSYDPRSKLANRFSIFKHDNVSILMRPDVRFGEPLLPSGYTAHCIYQAIKSEGGLEGAAKAYQIPLAEVEAAYRFNVNYLLRPAA